MPGRNIGAKRKTGRDAEIPAELARREAQDRPRPRPGAGGAQSPVDAMHVDAPTRQENARGNRRKKGR
jgi:hypothetical protein